MLEGILDMISARRAKCDDGRIDAGRVVQYHGRDQWGFVEGLGVGPTNICYNGDMHMPGNASPTR